jgi:hypothetical protein
MHVKTSSGGACQLLTQFLFGLALLCGAAYAGSLAWADRRSSGLAGFSAAISRWTGPPGERAPFAAADFSVAASLGAGGGAAPAPPAAAVALFADASPEAPLADAAAAAALPAYAPLRFRTPTGAALLPARGVDFAQGDADVAFTFTAAAAAGAPPSGFALPAPPAARLPLFVVRWASLSSKTGNGPAQCAQGLRGFWDQGRAMCMLVDRLAAVCLQVSQQAPPSAPSTPSAPAPWLPDASRGGVGCDAASGWAALGTYVRAPATGNASSGGKPFAGPVSFADLNVTVRAAADPFLAAQQLTGGGGDFGTSAEDATKAFALCLLFGLLCLAQPLAAYREELGEAAGCIVELGELCCCAPCRGAGGARKSGGGGGGGGSAGNGADGDDHLSDDGGGIGAERDSDELQLQLQRQRQRQRRESASAMLAHGVGVGVGVGVDDVRLDVLESGAAAAAAAAAAASSASPRPRRSASAGAAAAAAHAFSVDSTPAPSTLAPAAAAAAAAAAASAAHPALGVSQHSRGGSGGDPAAAASSASR